MSRWHDRGFPLAALVAAAAVGTAGMACGADDREMAEPSADQTTTTTAPGRTGGSAAAPGEDAGTADGSFGLTTAAFTPGTVIPDRYTCRGMDVWPGLSWSDVPEGTRSLAIVMRDVTAGGILHWVVTGIDPALDGLVEGELPAGAVESANHRGEPGWTGPCLEAGSGEHTYEFRIYALREPVDVDAGADGPRTVEAIETTPAYGSAVLLGTASP